MELSPLQLIGGAVSTAATGGGVSSFFAWLGGRRKTEAQAQAYAQGAVDHAVKTALGGMETAVDSLTGEVGRLSTKVAEGELQHRECERNLREVRSDLDESKREIARMLTEGKIAPAYDTLTRPVDPKRD